MFFTDDNGKPVEMPKELFLGNHYQVIGIDWKDWGESTAVGTGRSQSVDCTPNCAEGRIVYSDAEVRLSKLGNCRGRRQYLRVIVVDKGVVGDPAHSGCPRGATYPE